MKRLIAGIVAGLVLGVTGTAVAGQHYYWAERGTGYRCEGISSGVICKAGNYKVGTTPDYVYLQHLRTGETFGCHKRDPFYGCVSD